MSLEDQRSPAVMFSGVTYSELLWHDEPGVCAQCWGPITRRKPAHL